VGTGFGRAALEHLASSRGGQIFDPDCLTEDYENGFRLHSLGYPQIFLPIRFQDGRPVATREYFPRNFRSATRQRSRWVAGIVLQSWQQHGWCVPWRQFYWFWRDRKGLVGNLLSPFANLTFVAALLGAGSSVRALVPVWISHLCEATCAISLLQIGMRTWSTAQIYGWRFAAGVPLRTVWGNAINFRATVAALRQFTAARIRNRTMAWRKTEHVYPRPRLGEVLVRMRVLPLGEIEDAALDLPKGVRLGEYLVRLRKLTEESLYQALSLQAGIPAGSITPRDVDRMATRALPAEASRRFKVLPYRVEQGRLHIATLDLPSAELTRELAGLSHLEIHYRLVPPRVLNELLLEYLPPAAA
jgi:adsorption protein B